MEYLTVDQLANRMSVRRRTVLAWVKRGLIPVIRPSPKVLRFDPAAVVAALTVPITESVEPKASDEHP